MNFSQTFVCRYYFVYGNLPCSFYGVGKPDGMYVRPYSLPCWIRTCDLYNQEALDLYLSPQGNRSTRDCHMNFNPLTPNDHYNSRTAPLTSKNYILYIYSTNMGTKYFKHDIYCPFFSLQNAICFVILIYLVPVLFTFYIQGAIKFKKKIPAPKG